MGVHFVNAAFVGDGLSMRPTRKSWSSSHAMGGSSWSPWNTSSWPTVGREQRPSSGPERPHFHYVPAPNRSGLAAYYELHVWAWKRNPHGTFADWNPRVSCDGYVPQAQ